MQNELIIEYPLTWAEKLDSMVVGEWLPVDKRSSVFMAIQRNFATSIKEFKIRKSADGQMRVWRTK